MKENEKATTPAAQEERKKGSFLIRQDYLKAACHFLDNNSLGAVFRNIYDFVCNPSHVAKLEPLPSMCYFQLTEGIKEENEKYYKILARRQANYQDMKRRAASFGKNNSDKTDETDKTNETAENNFSLRNGKVNVMVNGKEGNATEGNATEGNAAVGIGTQDVVNNTTSNKKEYNSNNNLFFNKEYTRRYLIDKKMFLKKEAFENFFDYNVSIHWPYKPETAFRRWVKKNPDDEMKPAEIKKAPEQPATPAQLAEIWRKVLSFLVDYELCKATERKMIERLTFVLMQPTTGGFRLTFGAPHKSLAEYIRDNHQDNIKKAFEKILGGKVAAAEYVFPGKTEMMYLTDIHIDPLAPPKTTPMPEHLQRLLA